MSAPAPPFSTGSCSTTHGFTPGASPFGLTAWFDARTYTGRRTEVACEASGSGRSLGTHEDGAGNKFLHASAQIVGCARNVLKSLDAGRTAHIDALGQAFSRYSVLIWEDGSTDGSREAHPLEVEPRTTCRPTKTL